MVLKVERERCTLTPPTDNGQRSLSTFNTSNTSMQNEGEYEDKDDEND